MSVYGSNQKLDKLLAKGGAMFFTIELADRLFRGIVLLSPAECNYQKRAVYIKEYKYSDNKEA